ncbi:MAG TPA: HlyD family secretion protein [Caulobacteraceae bacterium]
MNQTVAMDALTGAAEIKTQKKKPPFASKKALVAVAGAAVLGAAGAGYILTPKSAESTDAAYVEADSSAVAPRIKGQVTEILVRHNQAVHRGDPLVRIDPEEFDARVASAAAELANAEAAVGSARAALQQLGAEQALAGANVRAAQTVIASTDAQSVKAQADRQRYDNLVASGAVARRDADTFRAAAVTAQSDADHSRAALDVARSQAGVVAAKRPVLEAALAQAEAAAARAKAALDLARQDQGWTVIRAPIDGVVGDRQAEPGDYVQPGTRLLTLVPLHAVYVTANFKETQIARMLPGQAARIRVDALPGVTLKGEVDSFAPGSGSQFSLLPFEPGTGNFTKIVQRVPVRIRLDPDQPALAKLRPGLSTTVTVRLKE